MKSPVYILLVFLFTLVPCCWALGTGNDGKQSEEPGSEAPDGEGAFDLADEFEFLEEAEVVESAARHKQKIGMSPSAITVITRDDIAASGAMTLPELLHLVPGMHVTMSSPFHVPVTARLDWNTENHDFLVLIDGREANLELLGMAPWVLQPISLQEIERIEVIRGPGSALYGANALAGVITITTTRPGREPTGWASLEGGNAGKFLTSAGASASFGDWGVSASCGGELSGTYQDPEYDAKSVWKTRALVEYRLGEKERFLLEGGFSGGAGELATTVGRLYTEINMQTVRMAYESEALDAQLYWAHLPMRVELNTPLKFREVMLARFVPADLDSHTIDGAANWTVPEFWEPLLIIVGAMGRASWLGSDQLLDASSYASPGKKGYHEPGISHWEERVGAFLHAEFEPCDWLTVTGGVRFDYNTVTGEAFSPRLAAVLQPFEDQFIRLGVASSFRKPSFLETHLHVMADIPPESPFQGEQGIEFQEFLTRVIGYSGLENEQLLAFEVGYHGRFFDGELLIGLDLYYNRYNNRTGFVDKLVIESGLPDLELSSYRIENRSTGRDVAGGELSLSYAPSRFLTLSAWWAHQEVIRRPEWRVSDSTPKNLLGVGGRFSFPCGLVGSLYGFVRSDFTDNGVPNPDGLLAGALSYKHDNVLLLAGRLGWRTTIDELVELEAGVKLFLPVSSFSAPHFEYYDEAGGISGDGRPYGGDLLGRVVAVYLQGSF